MLEVAAALGFVECNDMYLGQCSREPAPADCDLLMVPLNARWSIHENHMRRF